VTAVGPGGEPFVIGNRQLLLDEGVSIAVADAEAEACEARGLTALFIGLGGRVRAVVALQDGVRPGARAAVQRLFDLGIEVVLLSGDHHGTVEALAHNLDVAHVKSELLPEERVSEVRRLRETGRAVAVFGRGPYDDATVGAADVPVVLGAAGAHTGELTVALATDDVRDGAAALWIARATRLETWRGVLTAMGGGGLLVAAAAVGWAAPAVAAIGSLAIDAFALPAGARLLRRIELRVPARR
jgi:P-type E1-E2 ATPase